MFFYSPSTGGFYSEAIHGARHILVVDPDFVWPQIEAENHQYDPETSLDGPTILIDDPDVDPPIVEVDNPLCRMPFDVIEVSAAEHADLLAAEASGKRIQAGAGGKPEAVDPPAPTRTELCAAIDRAADAARLKVVGDPLRVVEYERAAAEAASYQAAGYSGEVPPSVQSWADAKSWTAQQAAYDILEAAAAFNAALYALRDIRLKGKEAVRGAADDAAAKLLAEAAITQIKAAVAGL